MEHFRVLIPFTCFFIVAAMNGSVEASKQFTVGDHVGWQQPSDNNTEVYTQWAMSKRFHIGDSITFEYLNDSVLMVEKWDYYHCNTIKPIYSFDDGNTVINLDRPGLFYFISGVNDHCKTGQKLMIQVMGLHRRPESPPPAIENTPDQVGIAPRPHHSSSGFVVTVTLTTVFLALIITVVALVRKERGKDSDQSSDESEGT